ncbi:LOW QUALITY PROTEIN: extended synaptotagmin-1-like [Falco peregrinus]|uniref:LOW QUALITY PROTEIN: extended synaptotagmin-1-like n=1 Tax=Falco peregrinus TaxID=8954 RepID=UPI0024799847|nr:LOW QUALITY PROTEIN: extended synaptotagmin-1-like [Falco peregrinus]
MTNLLDIPGLSSMSDTMIMDAIASYLVLPNRLLVPLVPDLHEAAQLRCPYPGLADPPPLQGVVRVHLRGARDLRSKDRFMGGLVEGKSDPYAVLRVGTQVVTSRVIDDNLNPTWDEVYEFIVHEVPGQELEVELFDKDPPIRMISWAGWSRSWRGTRAIAAKPDPPSAAILVVYLDRAEELPMKKPGKEPNPMVQVSVQDVVCNSSAPVWEDAFRFFLHDPAHQDLDIQVKDDPRQSSLGSLSLPLARLLDAPRLTLAQPFQLQHSGPRSRLHMKLVLRVLFLDAPENGVSPPTISGQPDPLASTSSTQRAPPTPAPNPQFGTEHMLRIHLLEAQDLIAKDNFFKGVVRGRSDPYARLRVAGRTFRSRVVKEDLNPPLERGLRGYLVIVDNVPGQDVEFDLFDKDIDKDDFLGRCKVPLRRVLSDRVVDEWLPLEDVKSGRLHVRLESLAPRPSAALLEQVLHTNSLLQPARGAELSAALLSVFVDRAADLPLRKGSKPPAAFASLAVRDVSFKTKTCAPTTEPVWDEAFSFLIKRPHVESLELQVLVSQQGGGGGPAACPWPGGTLPPQPAEAPGEEESGAGGLRQRLPPADR